MADVDLLAVDVVNTEIALKGGIKKRLFYT